MKLLGAFLNIVLFFSSIASVSSTVASSLEDLHYDENGRLASHTLIYSDGKCARIIEGHFAQVGMPYGYELQAVSGQSQKAYFGGEGGGFINSPPRTVDDCRSVCVERGVTRDLITAPLPSRRFEGKESFQKWFLGCTGAELCLMNYINKDFPIKVYWMRGDSDWKFIRDVNYGYSGWFCTNSYLGHKFKVEDSQTKELLLVYTVEFTSTVSVGEAPPYEKGFNYTEEVFKTHESEWRRKERVKRTFTALGFKKGRLPDDVYASMDAFHYNNRNLKVREEWSKFGRGVFVNWWDQDVMFVQIPTELRRDWSVRLKSLVEYWVDLELEETSMYGLRQYQEGARLLTHVDRESTHAASLIVNVAQGNVEEPWYVEVHDHAGRLHQVPMEPGDIVYYESASCLHGRNIPLKGKGAYYVNLFTHYRPIGDPLWYEKEIKGTEDPLIDIGECRVEGASDHTGRGAVECDNPSIGPYLSPSLFTATSAEDLFSWWRSVGPESTESGVNLEL